MHETLWIPSSITRIMYYVVIAFTSTHVRRILKLFRAMPFGPYFCVQISYETIRILE